MPLAIVAQDKGKTHDGSANHYADEYLEALVLFSKRKQTLLMICLKEADIP